VKDKIGLISGIILFAFLLTGMIYLISVNDENETNKTISEIKLSGNHLFSASGYMERCGLADKNKYKALSLQKIKINTEKHPYIHKAEVQQDGNGVVTVKVFEKEMKAVVINKSEANLISKNFEIIKLEDNSEISELPVITNTVSVKNISLLRTAFKIIDASSAVNPSMHRKLAEVNLRNGGEIMLRFSGIKYPVLFGKGNISKKIIELSAIWNKVIKNQQPFKNINYIDLRFNDEIFIGKSNVELNG